MYLKRFELGPMAANCYLIADENSKLAAAIDPGGDPQVVIEEIDKQRFLLKWIILTHGHGDHIGGVKKLQETTDAKLLIHERDKDMLTSAHKNLSVFMGQGITLPPADQVLQGGEELELGDISIEIIHTPGHTPGSISLKVDNMIFTGDTLFEGSVGRTDFPGGSHKELIDLIKGKLFPLGDHITVYPGHGPATNIKSEKATNPFLR